VVTISDRPLIVIRPVKQQVHMLQPEAGQVGQAAFVFLTLAPNAAASWAGADAARASFEANEQNAENVRRQLRACMSVKTMSIEDFALGRPVIVR